MAHRNIDQETFDSHPLVMRMREIFDDPKPVTVVTQWSWRDMGDPPHLFRVEIASRPWHEVGVSGSKFYLVDMAYMPLQQDLFDYLFPCVLIYWWRCTKNALELQANWVFIPILDAIRRAKVWQTMLTAERRSSLEEWMADAFFDALDTVKEDDPWIAEQYPDWAPDIDQVKSFHNLGQSVPVTGRILDKLFIVDTREKARWWLSFGLTLVGNPSLLQDNEPWVFDYPFGDRWREGDYLPENLVALREKLTLEAFLNALVDAEQILPLGPDYERIKEVQSVFWKDQARTQGSIDLLIRHAELGLEHSAS